jgi:hypothetical protein
MTQQLAVKTESAIAGFETSAGFELIQRQAKALSQSSLVPPSFQNNIPNCMIALDMAHRLHASPLMIVQNLYPIHGKPSWSSQFLIATVNQSGRFRPLRFHREGTGDTRGCVCWTVEADVILTQRTLPEARDDGLPILEGPMVTITMAKSEGWYGNKGSKWQTIPELMLMYRAATFWTRLNAPELSMGIRTEDEAEDIGERIAKAMPAQVAEIHAPTFQEEDEVELMEKGKEVMQAEVITTKPEKIEKKEPEIIDVSTKESDSVSPRVTLAKMIMDSGHEEIKVENYLRKMNRIGSADSLKSVSLAKVDAIINSWSSILQGMENLK